MARELTEFEKEVQGHITEILREVIDDNKRIIKRLQATIVLLAILLVGTFIYSEYSFRSFLNQYDIENTVTTTTNADNKVYDKNNSTHTNISDIEVNANKK